MSTAVTFGEETEIRHSVIYTKPGQTFIYCYSSQEACLLKVLHKLTEQKQQLCSSRGSSWEAEDLSHHTCQATKPFLLFCGKRKKQNKKKYRTNG